MKSLRSPARRPQRGAVLIFCLIILIVLLAGGVAVMRSSNTSMFMAGNLAFKRDLVNRAELATDKALKLFAPGGALAGTATDSDSKAQNYSAQQLSVNPQGVPLVLLSSKDDDFTAGALSNDIEADGTRVRYLIERLCNTTGAASLARCVYAPSSTEVLGGSVQESKRPAIPGALVYRLTVRVDGPRNTQVFVQSSFVKPQ